MIYRSMHKSLNDVAKRDARFAPGDTEIWYAKEPDFRITSKPDLARDFVLLGKIQATDLDEIYSIMQGDYWSPRGEARDLIRGLGLHHTSMSVGDVIVVGGEMCQVDAYGFCRW